LISFLAPDTCHCLFTDLVRTCHFRFYSIFINSCLALAMGVVYIVW